MSLRCLATVVRHTIDRDCSRSVGTAFTTGREAIRMLVISVDVRVSGVVYSRMVVHLLDGTYELFRHFYGIRRFTKGEDPPFGAMIGVLNTVLQMFETGATHLAVATDHVIESFRNDLWPGYKTGEGVEPALLAQFHPLEDALAAMGVAVWPMVELEADDALASGARIAAENPLADKICIWTPDKDLGQCVRGDRVVQMDRKT